MLNRREFLERGLLCGSLFLLPRLSWAEGRPKEPGARTLVMLHLTGGNDGLNTVVPYTDPLYRVLRPGLGIDASQVRKLDARLGLHPSLGGFEALWRRDRLAIVNGVGYPDPNYSHFRATEIYYTAQPDQPPRSGWLGRALDSRKSRSPLRAVALTKERPLSLACAAPGVVTLTRFDQFRLPAGSQEALRMFSEEARLGGERGKVAERALEAFKVARRIAALQPVRGSFYGGIGADLGKALALLRTDLDLEVIHMTFGGFDTHANQAGRQSGLLATLGNNLRAYQELLDRFGIADRVLTCVFSEFGRRATENLSGGTDHGWAYPVFLIGKTVRPGMHGAYPSLENLDAGNLRFTTDFRRLYAALLQDFLKVPPGPVLGNFEPLEVLA